MSVRKTLQIGLLLVALCALLLHSVGAESEVPKKAEQMLADCRVMLARGDELAALSRAEQALQLAPDWAAPHASLALLYQHQGDEAQAMEHLTRYQLLGLLASGAPDDPSTAAIARGEALMIYLTNQERASRGLPLLQADNGLSAVARGHAQEMARLDYFSHDSPTPTRRTPSDRFRLAYSYDAPCLGENLARMSSSPLPAFCAENLRESHAGLMDSEGHRQAILWDLPTHLGVGIAVDEQGAYWLDETFVRFR
jgi:uncharacterized protein YkwD